MQPLAEESGRIWETLRQESNIDLGGITLTGAGNHRRVAIDVSVDGVEGAALGVMSQGELHALGLALFIPRATSPESPFRFLLIDDPVQAMDPAKVDGLAMVLADAGQSRQVVVFTHDNRLPEAIRRLQLPATIWEVVRKPGSEVELRKLGDPVDRYLADAAALSKTAELSPEIRGPVVAGLARSALEAAAHSAYRRAKIAAGVPHADVEAAIETSTTTIQTLALGFYGDASQADKVFGRLNQISPAHADAFRACKEGVHGGTFGIVDRAGLHVHAGQSPRHHQEAPVMNGPPKASTMDRLEAVDLLLSASSSGTRGWWPRATAWLLRLELEDRLEDFWTSQGVPMVGVNMRSQLLLLPTYLNTAEAREIIAAWHGLSRAGHHHAYELAPTQAEIVAWATVVGSSFTRIDLDACS